jgi:hypothetical protein
MGVSEGFGARESIDLVVTSMGDVRDDQKSSDDGPVLEMMHEQYSGTSDGPTGAFPLRLRPFSRVSLGSKFLDKWRFVLRAKSGRGKISNVQHRTTNIQWSGTLNPEPRTSNSELRPLNLNLEQSDPPYGHRKATLRLHSGSPQTLASGSHG